jgi:hypothetical protein
MRGSALRIGWFWLRTSLRRHWANYLAIIILVGSIGGLALGSVAAARRTASSYNVFLTNTNPSDLTLTVYAPNISAELAKLPHVRSVAVSTYGVNAFPVGKHGGPTFPAALANGNVTFTGSLSKEYVTEDKLTVLKGRLANPDKTDEFVADVNAAKALHWHVGETIPMDFYTDAQVNQNNFSSLAPKWKISMHLVGLVVANVQVLVDEIDQKPELVFMTPATSRLVVNTAMSYNNYNQYALQVSGGGELSAVQREIIAALPPGTTYTFRVTAVAASEVNRSIEPEAIALGVFGLIAGLAALIIAAGLIARTIRRDGGDLEVLRALGGDTAMIASASLLTLVGTIILSALLSVVVAVVLSPLAPIGPVRSVYPYGGFNFDWTVLGLGFAMVLILLSLIAGAMARRRNQRVIGRARAFGAPVSSRLGRLAATMSLPVTAVVGVRFALEPGRERDAAPVRSALIGSVLAVAIVVTTLTFGSSLSTLVSHPPLYGWNWNYAIYGNGSGVPPQAAKLLNADPYVADWSGDNTANAQINGVTVPIILTTYHAIVSAPLLSGHEVNGPGQVVLGAATLQQLHKHLGDTVVATYGTPKDAPVYVPPTTLRIVGTATLPTLGGVLSQHPDLGVGAMVPISVEPPAFMKFIHSPYEAEDGYSMLWVRLRPGAPVKPALASLDKIAHLGTKFLSVTPGGSGSEDSVIGVQYPAEIENYRTIGAIPDVLAGALALGAIVALGLTLVASVHRRRRDLALLRTLGFRSRQLVATVAWQASVAGAAGVLVGVPVGIVTGRWLWILFARSVYVVPEPTVPVVSVVVVSACALVLVNVVAAFPGRSAARTSTAQVLRGE